MKIAGIDVHKKVLMVVVVDASVPEEKPARRRFVTLPSELQGFRIWLQEQGGEEAVMESTAQYWRSVWGPGVIADGQIALSRRDLDGTIHVSDFKIGPTTTGR